MLFAAVADKLKAEVMAGSGTAHRCI